MDTNQPSDALEALKRLAAEQHSEANITIHTQSTCPACGYCPHCGRGYHQPYYPTYPYPSPYQPPYYPTYPTWVSPNTTGAMPYPSGGTITNGLGGSLLPK